MIGIVWMQNYDRHTSYYIDAANEPATSIQHIHFEHELHGWEPNDDNDNDEDYDDDDT